MQTRLEPKRKGAFTIEVEKNFLRTRGIRTISNYQLHEMWRGKC